MDIHNQGYSRWALTDLTGGVSGSLYLTWEKLNQIGVENFKRWVTKYLADDGIFCTSNYWEAFSETIQSNGLVKGHDYSLLYLEDIETSNGKVTLVRIRNPWGRTEWNGAWSDVSSDWDTVSEEVKDRVGMNIFQKCKSLQSRPLNRNQLTTRMAMMADFSCLLTIGSTNSNFSPLV